MNLSEPLIYCPNSACSRPLNRLNTKFCENCQTPLVYRYLWAVGSTAVQIPVGEIVQTRYQVVAPQIWLDTRPDLSPETPERITTAMIPYLRLYPQNLHIPEVYGLCSLIAESSNTDILLLENIPVDSMGSLYPTMGDVWETASAVRQVYWLWQILQLWTPLAEVGAVSSLFIKNNLRVDGWRVRLCEIYLDPIPGTTAPEIGQTTNGNGLSSYHYEGETVNGNSSATISIPAPVLINSQLQPSLQQLGDCWADWFANPHSHVASSLLAIYQQIQLGESSLNAIAAHLNQILLTEAAKLHLRLRVVGATDTGPQSQHNEDSCYPIGSTLDLSASAHPLGEHLMIVCDGIGGHDGGEVASQLAVQSVKLQIQGLLMEVDEQEEITTPDLVAQQLEAMLRVVNNMIAARNDEQGRESRQRMATTLVMALQLPQKIDLADGIGNSHELYIVHVGDSRAYWITANSCQQLTVDDAVAIREVRLGRSLYRDACQRQDAGGLTQAIGTRDAEFLRPNVRRLILEEDGLLLLCSDGLSDNNLVEKSWQDYAEPVLNGQMSLDSAVEYLIRLANQKNGHDNTSVVLSYCRVSPEYPVLLNLGEVEGGSLVFQSALTPEVSEGEIVHIAEEQLAIQHIKPLPTPPARKSLPVWMMVLGLLVLVMTGGAIGLWTWWQVYPRNFEHHFVNPEPPSTSSPAPKSDQ